MSLDLWPAMPRLAVGSHPAGTGKGCLMNIISWGNGDVEITDMPACTHPVLARAATVLNDAICTHRDSDLLCVSCSATMFGYEPLLVGTAPPSDPLEAKRLAVALAVALRPLVGPLWRPQDRRACAAAMDAAQAWLECPCDKHGRGARTAYIATNAAAVDAAHAAYTAASAAVYAAVYAAAYTADTATNAASAASAASAAASAVAFAASAADHYAGAYITGGAGAKAVLDTLIDAYYTPTGRPRPAPDPQRLNRALTAAGLV